MIKVHELKSPDDKKSVADKFGLESSELYRIFGAVEEGSYYGAVSMTYDSGICFKVVTDDAVDYERFDLLVRAALSLIRDIKGQRVYIKSLDPYYENLGFKKRGDLYETTTDAIVFKGCCGR